MRRRLGVVGRSVSVRAACWDTEHKHNRDGGILFDMRHARSGRRSHVHAQRKHHGAVMITRCLVCNEPLSRIGYFDGWCVDCAGKVLHEILSMGDLKPSEIRIMADMFRQVQAPMCAKVIERVPFDAQPSAATLERLTDE